MIKNTYWESIVGVIVWVFIIWFIILWVSNLLISSKTMINEYYDIVKINIIESNTIKIANKIDLSSIAAWEIFYIYKDTTTNEFSTFTWLLNEEYKYIDWTWEKIDDLTTYIWNIYSRELVIERKDSSIWETEHQVIKATITKYIQY